MTGSISPSGLQSIGHTALVELRNVVPQNCATVLAKLEWQNPTGSMKDRMAIAAISRAEEGLFAGTSSGANVCAAIEIAKKLGSASTVVTLMIDSGLKYLSTDLYSGG